MAKFTINFLRAYCLVAGLLLLTIGGLAVINKQAVDVRLERNKSTI